MTRTLAPPLPDEWALAARRFRDGQVAPRELGEMRQLAKDGLCPLCGRGPFIVVAQHTAQVHEIDRRELRDRLGFLWAETLTDPSYHARQSARAKRAIDPQRLRRAKKGPRKFSAAGRAAQARKGGHAHARNPDLQERMTVASVAAKAAELELAHRLVVETYEAVVRERGMAYGAVKETANRLGWPESTTLRRIEAAWRRGMGSADRVVRGSEESRTCAYCGELFTVTRTRGWDNKYCSRSCGAKRNGARTRKAAREAVCSMCGRTFIYRRRGTKPRTLCDQPACRAELARRTRRMERGVRAMAKVSEDDRVQYHVDELAQGSWRSVRRVYAAGSKQRCKHKHADRADAVACMSRRQDKGTEDGERQL